MSEQFEGPGFDRLWNSALTRYLQATNRSDEEQGLLKDLHNPEDLRAKLEADRARFGTFREKHARIYKALSDAVRPFMTLADVAQSAISTTPIAPASTLLGAILFLVKSAEGVSDAYDSIESLFERLTSFSLRLNEYVGAGMNSSLQHNAIDILTCLLEVLARSEQVVRDGRWKKYLGVTLLGKDDQIQNLFKKLESLFVEEERLVVAISYATNQRVEKTTAESLEQTKEITSKLDGLVVSAQDGKAEKMETYQSEILNKNLLTPAYDSNITVYSEYVESTMKNSGQWLFAEKDFDQWLNRKIPLLSISGGPGVGKSSLSSIAVTKLVSVYPQDPDHPNRTSVAYFFIKEHDQELQNLSSILKTLAYQIAQVDPVFRSHTVATLSAPERTATTRQIWDNLFLSFFQSKDLPNAAMIVLDGLDEAPRSLLKELFLLLEDIADTSNTEPRICFCLLFRPEVQEYFGPKVSSAISRITAESKTEKDIQRYIKEHLKKILVVNQTSTLKSPRAAAILGKRIRDRIVFKADGIFFKVVLILKDIEDKERVPAVLEAIEQSPPALDKMIEHVFEKLLRNEDVSRDDLQEILLWVSFAKRPLRVAELYYVLKSRTGNAYEALESRLRGRFASIFRLIQGSPVHQKDPPPDGSDTPVVAPKEQEIDIDDPSLEDYGDDFTDNIEAEAREIEKATENDKDGLNDETVHRFNMTTTRFLHSSIRNFLVKPPKDDWPVVISVDSSLADAHIASACITRMLDVDKKEKPCDLLGYATLYFTNHVMSIDFAALTDESRQSVFDLIFRLFQEDGMLALLLAMDEADNGSALKLIQDLFESTQLTDYLQTNWFANMTPDDCPEQHWEWIQKSRSSRVELLRPVALNACRLWMTKRGHEDPAYVNDDFQVLLVWIIYFFVQLEESTELNLGLSDLHRLFAFESPSKEQKALAKIAKLGDFLEKTSHWHTSYGTLLRISERYDDAISQFQQAVDLDKNAWKALEGLARSYTALEEYDKATIHLNQALDVVPETFKPAVREIRASLIEVMIRKRDFQNSLQYAKAAFEEEPDNDDYARVYVQSLYALGHFKQIVDIVRSIQSQGKVVLGRLSSLIEEVCRACYDQHAVKLLEPEFNLMLYDNSPVTPYMALFVYTFYEKTDSAIRLWEKSLNPTASDMLLPQYNAMYKSGIHIARTSLGGIYYQKAVDERLEGRDPTEWENKLRDLAANNTLTDSPRVEYQYTISAPSLSYGTYLRKYAKAEPEKWMPWFRNSLLLALDMLCDDDPINDLDAYKRCIINLLGAGDFHNAQSAAAVCFMPLSMTDSSWLTAARKLHFAKHSFSCDGLCSTSDITYNSDYEALHFCVECLDVAFCEICYPKLLNSELPMRICHPKHEFLQLYPVPEEAKGVAAQFDGEKMIVRQEWLDDLRKTWS